MSEETEVEALRQRLDEVEKRLASQERLVAQLQTRLRSLEARVLQLQTRR
jgi:uncharacterized coiled-coil protein SlyX